MLGVAIHFCLDYRAMIQSSASIFTVYEQSNAGVAIAQSLDLSLTLHSFSLLHAWYTLGKYEVTPTVLRFCGSLVYIHARVQHPCRGKPASSLDSATQARPHTLTVAEY